MGCLINKTIIFESGKTLSRNISIQIVGNGEQPYKYVHASFINLGVLSMQMPYNPLGGRVLDKREVT